MDQGRRRSPARFLAPLALIAVVVAFAGIVTGSADDGTSSSTSTTSSSKADTTTEKSSDGKSGDAPKKKSAKKKAARETYTVQPGDTLGSIADKTGVALERIEELNPDVDPHAMVAGQKIRLK